jgi:hypothetical protein
VITGLVYTYSAGMKQHMYVNQPELVKEMNQCITLDLGKPSYITKRLSPLLGNGILRSNGHIWAQHRKIVAPEFFMDKVKVTDQNLFVDQGSCFCLLEILTMQFARASPNRGLNRLKELSKLRFTSNLIGINWL